MNKVSFSDARAMKRYGFEYENHRDCFVKTFPNLRPKSFKVPQIIVTVAIVERMLFVRGMTTDDVCCKLIAEFIGRPDL